MKSVVILAFVILGGIQCMGQAAVYNAYNEYQSEKLGDYTHSLETQTVTQRNKISGTTVVEIYEQGTGKFLGYWGDPNKFKLKDLPYIKNTKAVKKLMKSHTIPVAIAIHQEAVIKGMSIEEASKSWGDPNKIEQNTDGQTVMRYDDATIQVESGKVVSVTWFE